jgi:uncharacterized lipoprotein YmbA
MRFLLTLTLALSLAACGSSPNPVYYSLTAQPGETFSSKPLVIKVQRPGLDATLDKPELVRKEGSAHTQYDGADTWSEPLGNMIERVVAENLQQRLPGSTVITESGDIAAHPDYLVAIEVRQFGIDGNAQAVMEVVLSINKPDAFGKPQPVRLTQATGNSTNAQIQTLSSLLAVLSNQIARTIDAHR